MSEDNAKKPASPQQENSTTKAPVAKTGANVQRLKSGLSIVPSTSIAGNALIFVIAIMSFLACVTLGAVSMVNSSAEKWQSDISREVTIQIRPTDDIEMQDAIDAARKLALATDGVARVTVLDNRATVRLLEPWLGSGLKLDELPVPRILTVTVNGGAKPDFAALRDKLEEQVPGSSLDDHRAWVDRLTTMANTVISIGTAIFLLVMAATVTIVVFATRGAMAGNKDVVEVLHFVGADGKFISSQFQGHFLVLGLKGAAAGALVSIILFLMLGFWTSQSQATPQADQISALFGTFSIGWTGYLSMIAVTLLVALICALTSMLTVRNQVNHLQDYRKH